MTNTNDGELRYDWKGTRGRSWRQFVQGYEGTLAPVTELLIGALAMQGPCRIAEVGSGGGGASLELAAAAPPGSHVDGFDISEDLLEYARGRSPEGGPAFHLADMGVTAPPGERYQRLVSRFGVMFFVDDDAAFRNLRSWLYPDGRFAFAVWGPMVENRWCQDVDDVAGDYVSLPAPPTDGPGPDRYADAQEFQGQLSRCGFRDVHVNEWRGALPVGGGVTAGEAAQFVLSAFNGVSTALDEAGVSVRRQVEEALKERWRAYETGGVVRVPARVHVISGRAA